MALGDNVLLLCYSEKAGDRQEQVMTPVISGYYMCYATIHGNGCAR